MLSTSRFRRADTTGDPSFFPDLADRISSLDGQLCLRLSFPIFPISCSRLPFLSDAPEVSWTFRRANASRPDRTGQPDSTCDTEAAVPSCLQSSSAQTLPIWFEIESRLFSFSKIEFLFDPGADWTWKSKCRLLHRANLEFSKFPNRMNLGSSARSADSAEPASIAT